MAQGVKNLDLVLSFFKEQSFHFVWGYNLILNLYNIVFLFSAVSKKNTRSSSIFFLLNLNICGENGAKTNASACILFFIFLRIVKHKVFTKFYL